MKKEELSNLGFGEQPEYTRVTDTNIGMFI